jgi:ornithine carbamoyltransferase
MTDFLSIADLSAVQVRAVIELARVIKSANTDDPYAQEWILRGKSAALIFEKPSLRTRVTFEVAMYQLGGKAIHLAPSEIQMGTRESVPDVARNLERWVHGIVARTHRHETLLELAENAKVPVINALSDRDHPCQALADLLTLKEHQGDLKGLRLAYLGDGNNVANSLLHACARLGVHMTLGCPEGYEPDSAVLAAAQEEGGKTSAELKVVRDPRDAVQEADAIYTDVWASMGQEAEAAAREPIFRPYQLNAELLAAAREPLVMHCLPAHRGREITDEVMDGPQSVVFDQAENRLHVQKAILAVLL